MLLSWMLTKIGKPNSETSNLTRRLLITLYGKLDRCMIPGLTLTNLKMNSTIYPISEHWAHTCCLKILHNSENLCERNMRRRNKLPSTNCTVGVEVVFVTWGLWKSGNFLHIRKRSVLQGLYYNPRLLVVVKYIHIAWNDIDHRIMPC